MQLKPTRLLIFIAIIVFMGISFFYRNGSAAHRSVETTLERSLEIERNPNEPYELVDILVSAQSIKNKIEVTHRREDGGGLDTVRFAEDDDWFKRISVKIKNVSTKPIIDMRAYLYLKSQTPKTWFSLDLTPSGHLQTVALRPGEETDLTVTDQAWNQTSEIMRPYGLDGNSLPIRLYIEFITFNDQLVWHAGHLIRVDPVTHSGVPVNNFVQKR